MIEIFIVAALVLWSMLVVFKKVFPNTSNSVFQKLSDACAAKGWVWPNGCNRVWLQAVVATVPVRFQKKVQKKSQPNKR